LLGTTGAGVIVQDDPFHRSASVKEWVFGALSEPTAMHQDAPTQDI
jgi:hypothetical protein